MEAHVMIGEELEREQASENFNPGIHADPYDGITESIFNEWCDIEL